MVLKIKDSAGNVQKILVVKGRDGKDYVLTAADKREIAEMVAGTVHGGGGEINAMIDRSITSVSSDVVLVGEGAFNKCAELVSADFPLATKIGHNAFAYCANLQSINIPLVANIGQQTFSNCTNLKKVYAPCVTFINSNAFYRCERLESVDLGSETYVSGYSFANCYSLKAVIMRSAKVNNLVATSAFGNCSRITGQVNDDYNPDGVKDGYFYVPRSILSGYTGNSGWGTWSSQFRALEDYTVDGTTTGALDASKL